MYHLLFSIFISYSLGMMILMGIPLLRSLLSTWRGRWRWLHTSLHTPDPDITDDELPPDLRERTQAIRDIYTIAHDPALWQGTSSVSRKVILLSSPLARAMIAAVRADEQEEEDTDERAEAHTHLSRGDWE